MYIFVSMRGRGEALDGNVQDTVPGLSLLLLLPTMVVA